MRAVHAARRGPGGQRERRRRAPSACPRAATRSAIAPFPQAGSIVRHGPGQRRPRPRRRGDASAARAPATRSSTAAASTASSRPASTAAVDLRDLTITGGDSTAGNSQEIDLGGGILNKGAHHARPRRARAQQGRRRRRDVQHPARRCPMIRDSLIARNTAFAGGGLRIDQRRPRSSTRRSPATRCAPAGDLDDKPVGIVVPTVDEISGYGGGIDHRGGGDADDRSTRRSPTTTRSRAAAASAPARATRRSRSDLPLGHVELRNTIIAGNTQRRGHAGLPHQPGAAFTSLGHNLDTDGSCCLLSRQATSRRPTRGSRPLADNGGPTAHPGAAPRAARRSTAAAAEGARSATRAASRARRARACDIGAFERRPTA